VTTGRLRGEGTGDSGGDGEHHVSIWYLVCRKKATSEALAEVGGCWLYVVALPSPTECMLYGTL
jgi:hypothetical protein